MTFWPAERVMAMDVGSPFTQAFDNTGGSSGKLPLYIGATYPGKAKSDPAWRIYKLTYDANDNVTDLKWADGNDEFDNIWDNRTGYTYS